MIALTCTLVADLSQTSPCCITVSYPLLKKINTSALALTAVGCELLQSTVPPCL